MHQGGIMVNKMAAQTPKKFRKSITETPIETNYRLDNVDYGDICYSPTQMIIVTLVAYFNSFSEGNIFNIFYNEIYGYERDDLMSTSLPAMLIYVQPDRKSRKTTDMGYYTRWITMDIVLPPMAQRDRLTETMNNLHDIIFNMFTEPTGQLFKFVTKGMPFVKFLACDLECEVPRNKRIKDCAIERFTFDFVIDIQSYYDWLEAQGYQAINPCLMYNLWETTQFDAQPEYDI